MANIISQTDYNITWQQINENTQYPDESHTGDFINYCPENLGKGYHRQIQFLMVVLSTNLRRQLVFLVTLLRGSQFQI